ncbi:hypothetical protein BBO01nite_13890 [Brevibacillus borstelensis]|nr:hypothetical protein BBO01nite_13890 [Brevibacillus borstelensis]
MILGIFILSMLSFACLLSIAMNSKELVKQNKQIIELLQANQKDKKDI